MNKYTYTHSVYPSAAIASSASRLLALGEQKRSGLILCKAHYAEFVGPGSAICNPIGSNYTKIIVIGSPEFVEVTSYEARQQAYSRRIQWVRWLQRIVNEADPIQRADHLLSGFEEFFGSEVLAGIPNDSLALLAGGLPTTIATQRACCHRTERHEVSPLAFYPQRIEVKVLTLDTIRTVFERLQPTLTLNNAFAKALSLLPCSA